MVGQMVKSGIEFAGSWGMGTLIGCAVNKIIPETLSTAEKICVFVGAEMITMAANRVVVREFEGAIDDLKEAVNEIKKANKEAKAVKAERKVKTVKVKTTKQAEKA